MDAYQDQEDEISRLSAIISNLKVDYESTISILQKDLAKATATIAELDLENQELAHTLQEIDQECSDTTSSLESLAQENRDLRRRVDQLVHECDELAAKLQEKEQRGSEYFSKEKVELMPADSVLRNDHSLLNNKTVSEEKCWDCLKMSNQSISRKQDSYNTIETFTNSELSSVTTAASTYSKPRSTGWLTAPPNQGAPNDTFPEIGRGERSLPSNIQISATDTGLKKCIGSNEDKNIKSTGRIFNGMAGFLILTPRNSGKNDLLVDFGDRLRHKR
jgi:FtsZ-binding cell division protein ZapB